MVLMEPSSAGKNPELQSELHVLSVGSGICQQSINHETLKQWKE